MGLPVFDPGFGMWEEVVSEVSSACPNTSAAIVFIPSFRNGLKWSYVDGGVIPISRRHAVCVITADVDWSATYKGAIDVQPERYIARNKEDGFARQRGQREILSEQRTIGALIAILVFDPGRAGVLIAWKCFLVEPDPPPLPSRLFAAGLNRRITTAADSRNLRSDMRKGNCQNK